MTHVINDRNRRNITLFTSKTGEVLPSYYEQDNPKLIQLLDEYYNFLDSSGRQSFSNIISETFATIGFTGTVRFHLIFTLPCQSCGTGVFSTVVASATNVIVQSPGDVSSYI